MYKKCIIVISISVSFPQRRDTHTPRLGRCRHRKFTGLRFISKNIYVQFTSGIQLPMSLAQDASAEPRIPGVSKGIQKKRT